jgi:hypothetical protein
MSHTLREHDGLKVYVVTDMDRRFDEEGKLLSSKEVDNLELVHASDIAKYFGIPLRDIGKGDSLVPGIWTMVFENTFGQRVPYNDDHQIPGDRNVRQFVEIKDATGKVVDTKEKIVLSKFHHRDSGKLERGMPLLIDTCDGMFVRLSDLLEYAEAQGWKKGAGRPHVEGKAKNSASVDEKLDKLTDLVTGLATIMAQQVVQPAAQQVVQPAAKK